MKLLKGRHDRMQKLERGDTTAYYEQDPRLCDHRKYQKCESKMPSGKNKQDVAKIKALSNTFLCFATHWNKSMSGEHHSVHTLLTLKNPLIPSTQRLLEDHAVVWNTRQADKNSPGLV